MAERLSFSTSRQYSRALRRVTKLEDEIICLLQCNARCQREAKLFKKGGGGLQSQAKEKGAEVQKAAGAPWQGWDGISAEAIGVGNLTGMQF